MTVSKRVEISAPGKIILSGEHAVVYGYPAIVAAVDRRLWVNEKYEVKSEIPLGCGMGSSAAYAVATSALKLKLNGKPFDKEKINEMAYRLEKRQHGSPSGVDNTVCTYGGFLWYRKEVEEFKTFMPIKVQRALPEFLIYNTGRPVESTKEMMEMVRERKAGKVLVQMEKVTRSVLKVLRNGNGDLLETTRENERLLEELGVVSKLTVEIVRRVEKMGGAAKISGAGGKKEGSGIILMYHSDMERLRKFTRKERMEVFKVRLGEGGVRSE